MPRQLMAVLMLMLAFGGAGSSVLLSHGLAANHSLRQGKHHVKVPTTRTTTTTNSTTTTPGTTSTTTSTTTPTSTTTTGTTTSTTTETTTTSAPVTTPPLLPPSGKAWFGSS